MTLNGSVIMDDVIIPELVDNSLGEIAVTNSIDKKNEYELILQGLTGHEKAHCQRWYIEFSDYVTWEDYKKKGYQHLAEVVEEVQNHILKATGKPQQLKLAFMPTEIARTSPFFPMSRANMKQRLIYTNFVIDNKWGTIKVSGPQLSISDESVLLAVLFLAKKYKADKFGTDYAELCKIMGIERGNNTYKAIADSLERLTMSIVNTKLFDTENLEKREVVRSVSGAILSNVDQKQKATTVEISLNPYFLALYGANLTTGIDLERRSKIKGDISKALYRFLETHKGGGVPYGLLTLCQAINLNTEQRVSDIRKIIRKAFAELQRQGIIKRWKMDKNDLIHLSR